MRKNLTLLLMALLAFLSIGCGTDASLLTTSMALAAQEEAAVEMQSDLSLLRAFLLGNTAVMPDADLDRNHDGRWNAVDLTLLKREQLQPDAPAEPEILVAYFSCTGNTETLAGYLADTLHAPQYEIVPEIPYTEDDLKYYTDCRADKEQKDPDARPAIAGSCEQMDDADILFLGYPIWHGQAPKILCTFLESYDCTGKTIIPFCTSGSSPIGTSASNLQAAAPTATWLEGKRFAGSTTAEEIAAWVSGLPLPTQKEENMETFTITANDTVFHATFADNASAVAFRELLQKGDVTVDMHDYGSFEKVGSLGTTLPRCDEQITTEAGDVILYLGNQITVYYDTNSWNFTRLGKIQNATKEALLAAFGQGDVTITFSL